MLKKQKYPTSNSSVDVLLIISGAKKRRKLAYCAVKSVNSQLGFKPELLTVK